MPLEITDIIAERELTFVEANGTRHPCRLVFGKIYEEEEMGFCCPFQILGYGDEKFFKIYGVDSLQAFLLAIESTNVELAHCFPAGTFLAWDSSEDLFLVARDLRQ